MIIVQIEQLISKVNVREAALRVTELLQCGVHQVSGGRAVGQCQRRSWGWGLVGKHATMLAIEDDGLVGGWASLCRRMGILGHTAAVVSVSVGVGVGNLKVLVVEVAGVVLGRWLDTLLIGLRGLGGCRHPEQLAVRL